LLLLTQATMKFIFFGDIVGRIGREAVKRALADLKTEHEFDLIIANGENLAHGKGVTEGCLMEMRDAGIDLFTSGNHIWRQKGTCGLFAIPAIAESLMRPANYPAGVPGQGTKLRTVATKNVLVINLLGRVFMPDQLDDPFRTFDEILRQHAAHKPAVIFVDFHAEATSEKLAFAWYAAERGVSVVVGTHTHVPTADARILPGGTAYITDVGMCGFADGVLGVTKEPIVHGFRTQLPVTHELPDHGNAVVSAVIIEINTMGRATSILPWHHVYHI
jgi:metallophosphoesterase (TIGR00282 family)